ncbi:hypothetical protein I547_1175 [Mycobacterium kansasii 824]|uniref:Uncharacterized protein n=1 Tax=Mycobacterium kansasii TaxID=1768 RepID=A0A1V3XWN9_MYCKA|nr:hypothetical protein I547_1175 [Mycobacterium kansasii 824]OOK83639.1 hypothetical protein BZL29_0298 [Mycobacterium kansasii]
MVRPLPTPTTTKQLSRLPARSLQAPDRTQTPWGTKKLVHTTPAINTRGHSAC